MNRLQNAQSPHLRRHADDPVNWHPWDAEALALARSKKKPILLSIGFTASHPCQLMARESFNSTQIAKLMNDNFVNIMVDREERPDLDRLYQSLHQLLNRKPGGWPLTVFLDPEDHLPLFSGTYFPPQARHDAPAFREVLKGMSKVLSNPGEKLAEFKSRLREALAHAPGSGGPGDIDATLVERACAQIDSSFDEQRGGFSGAPKYAHPSGLALMLDAADCATTPAQSARLLEMLDFTLAAMTRGGMHDHVGGGFFRYSADADWDIPGFEKMLYDNSLLLSVLARRAARTGSPWLQSVTARTARWLTTRLQLDNGALAASLDADLNGTEGRYYTWTYDELTAALGEDYAAFAPAFGLDGKANFKDNWHLRMAAPVKDETISDEALPDALARGRDRLLAARDERDQPARDDKVVSSWNALAVRALADAAILPGCEDCLAPAGAVVDYLHQTHWRDGRLVATSHEDTPGGGAYLDDYVYLLDALLKLLSVRWRTADLEFAVALADALLANFEDKDAGGFWFTAHDHEALIQRTKPYADDALPAGNGRAVSALLELAWLSGETRYADAAQRALRCGMTDAERWPSAHASLMSAVLDFTNPPTRAMVFVRAGADTSPWQSAPALTAGGRTRSYLIPQPAPDVISLPAGCEPDATAPITAFVRAGGNISAAITSVEEFVRALDA